MNSLGIWFLLETEQYNFKWSRAKPGNSASVYIFLMLYCLKLKRFPGNFFNEKYNYYNHKTKKKSFLKIFFANFILQTPLRGYAQFTRVSLQYRIYSLGTHVVQTDIYFHMCVYSVESVLSSARNNIKNMCTSESVRYYYFRDLSICIL